MTQPDSPLYNAPYFTRLSRSSKVYDKQIGAVWPKVVVSFQLQVSLDRELEVWYHAILLWTNAT